MTISLPLYKEDQLPRVAGAGAMTERPCISWWWRMSHWCGKCIEVYLREDHHVIQTA